MSADNTMETRSRLTEARARIIWGDPPNDVVQWLVSKGDSPVSAEAAVRSWRRERADEIRRMGLRDLLLGVPLAVAGTAGCVESLRPGLRYTDSHEIFAGAALMAVIGAWRVLKGIGRIIEGAAARGSIPDLE